jgi:outer membrane immunogenic protein
MKKLFLSATAIATIMSASAFSADLPSIKSAPVAAPVPMWTGFYAGLNAGYGFGTSDNAQNYGWANPNLNDYYRSNNAATASAVAASYPGRNIAQGGFIGGGQVGYNYHYGQSFVLGLETDIQGAGIKGQGNANGYGPIADGGNGIIQNNIIQAGVNWMGTARGRAGYLVTPSMMIYGTGGLAYGQAFIKTFQSGAYFSDPENADAFATVPTNKSAESLLVGWTAGGGFEWIFMPNWSLKGEALYYDLGNLSVSNTTFWAVSPVSPDNQGLMSGSTSRAYYQGVIARAGVNHHFDFASLPSASVFATTLPSTKSAPVAAPVPMWTGFYAGLNAGYGFGTSDNAQNYGWANPNINDFYGSNNAAAASAVAASYPGRNISQGGFIGGGQVGYNYQYGQSFVLGLETDIQGAGIKGQGNANGYGPIADGGNGIIQNNIIQAGVNWMGTARGRAGYLVTPSMIIYGTGGLAYGQGFIKTFQSGAYSSSPFIADAYATVPTNKSAESLLVGWTAGGGFEWMFMPNWSLKGEALYYHLGNLSVSNTTFWAASPVSPYNQGIMSGSTTQAYYQGVISRAGVNYHFDFGRAVPVVAKF